MHVIWIDNSEHMKSLFNDSAHKIRYFEEVLLRRLKHHLALRVFDLSSLLSVSEDMSEKLWRFIQNIMRDAVEVFYKHMHLDTLILCALYMI